MAGFAGIVFDSDGFLRFLVMAVISNAALGTWLSPDEIQDRIVLLGLLVLSPVLFAAFLVFLFAL